VNYRAVTPNGKLLPPQPRFFDLDVEWVMMHAFTKEEDLASFTEALVANVKTDFLAIAEKTRPDGSNPEPGQWTAIAGRLGYWEGQSIKVSDKIIHDDAASDTEANERKQVWATFILSTLVASPALTAADDSIAGTGNVLSRHARYSGTASAGKAKDSTKPLMERLFPTKERLRQAEDLTAYATADQEVQTNLSLSVWLLEAGLVDDKTLTDVLTGKRYTMLIPQGRGYTVDPTADPEAWRTLQDAITAKVARDYGLRQAVIDGLDGHID
jgi:hypothetical protein